LVRFRFSISRLDIQDLDYAFLVVDPMTSFSRTRLKTSAIQNVAKVIESEIIV